VCVILKRNSPSVNESLITAPVVNHLGASASPPVALRLRVRCGPPRRTGYRLLPVPLRAWLRHSEDACGAPFVSRGRRPRAVKDLRKRPARPPPDLPRSFLACAERCPPRRSSLTAPAPIAVGLSPQPLPKACSLSGDGAFSTASKGGDEHGDQDEGREARWTSLSAASCLGSS
jgi:hypothetical protein